MSLKIYTSTEFKELEPPASLYLVNPIVPLGGIVFVYGKSGVGKSPLSWALADAVARGTEFLGMATSGPVPVLYVDVDTRWWTIQERWKGAGYEPNFDIAVGEGFDCMSPMWDYSEVRAILQKRQAERHYKLVVISTLAKIHHFSFAAADAPAEVYTRWQAVFGEECAIVFIHHDKKSTAAGDGADEDSLYHITRESFSGNQQWLDHATTALHLTRRGSDYKFTLEQTKDQGSRKAEPMKCVLSSNGVVVSLEVEAVKKDNWLE